MELAAFLVMRLPSLLCSGLGFLRWLFDFQKKHLVAGTTLSSAAVGLCSWSVGTAEELNSQITEL